MAKRPSRAPTVIVGLVGLASIGWGAWLWTQEQVGSQSVVAASGASAGAPSGRTAPGGALAPPVHGGSGTWTAVAPANAKSAAAGALCAGCDIVVITMCSMRRDHVSAYGLAQGVLGGKPLTPRLDALTAGGFRMDQAWAASNFTLAGLTALLTGRFGSSTGVTGWDKGLVKDVPTLPEVLGYYGYRSGAFTIDAPSGFRPDYGLDRGFQHMQIIPPPRDTPDGRSSGGEPGPGGESALPAAAWIAAQDQTSPMFVMFHTRTAHYPFVLEDDPDDATGVTHLLWGSGGLHPTSQAMPGTAGGTAQRGVVALAGVDPVQVGVLAAGAPGIAVWKQRYAESVARMDIDLGVIADALEARGRLDKSIIVVLADHGESIDDHGELLHGDAYFDGVVHIPMLIRVGGMAGRPVSALTSQVDVLPTLLDLVGAVSPAGIDGNSMVPLFTGKTDAVRSTTLVEGGVSWHDDGHPRGAVVALPWAMLKQDRGCGGGVDVPRGPGEPATCLFNLETDPGQERNVAASHPEVLADLQARWDKFRAAHSDEGTQLSLDPAFVKELQRTGYNFRPEEQ
ncbi:MAG: hypothetical protein EXR69_07085 [Myxococcales bacterium]|nr:hypothetical protein [Myxococcales bacterium]